MSLSVMQVVGICVATVAHRYSQVLSAISAQWKLLHMTTKAFIIGSFNFYGICGFYVSLVLIWFEFCIWKTVFFDRTFESLSGLCNIMRVLTSFKLTNRSVLLGCLHVTKS